MYYTQAHKSKSVDIWYTNSLWEPHPRSAQVWHVLSAHLYVYLWIEWMLPVSAFPVEAGPQFTDISRKANLDGWLHT